jgi:D-arabinose 1-dehydrogenase-like Zn-dependent alcohol dehydrogenase
VNSRQQAKLDLALKFGADASINTSQLDIVEEIQKLTDGDMCDIVIDNIGNEISVQQSIDLTRPGGRVVVVGYVSDMFAVNYQKLVIKEREILGLRGGTPSEMWEIIKLVDKGVVTPYVCETYQFSEINYGLKKLREGKNLARTVVVFD